MDGWWEVDAGMGTWWVCRCVLCIFRGPATLEDSVMEGILAKRVVKVNMG